MKPLASALLLLAAVACGSESPPPAAPAPVPLSNSPDHAAFCEPTRHDGFVSTFACTHDSECVPCHCRPINRTELARVGGFDNCRPAPPASEECIATNPACCNGVCVLAR